MAGEARGRVLAAALDLFAEHGVEGTSLQMIADEIGVTKAAVYFQFRAKDDIVVALLEPALAGLASTCTAAEAHRTRPARVDAVVSGIVDIVVEHRRLMALLHRDPVVGTLLEADPRLKTVIDRTSLLLLGPDPDDESRVVTAMLGSALMTTGADPTLADVPDETLRRTLLATARRMLGLRRRP